MLLCSPENGIMRKSTITLLLLFVSTAGRAALPAGPDRDDRHALGADTLEQDLVTAMNTREEVYFQDTYASTINLENKDGSLVFGIGGMVRVVMAEEFGGIIDSKQNVGFITALIPTSLEGMPHSQFRLSAGTSQIFVKMANRTKKLGDVVTFISIDFQGGNYAPRLREAYVQIGHFVVGQAWNTISDLASLPPGIDFQGPSGRTGFRNPMVRYQNDLGKHFTYGAALEFPIVNATYNDDNHAILQSIPDVTGFWQYRWGWDGESHVRLTGVMRNMAYHDDISASSRIKTGWGVQLSGVTTIVPRLTGYYRYVYGKGIGSYIADLAELPVDLLPDPYSPGRMVQQGMYGWFVGLKYAITKSVFVSAVYSQSGIYNGDGVFSGNDYRRANYFAADLFWDITPRCEVAAEYLYGNRIDIGGAKGSANRVNLLMKYSF